MTTIKKFLLLSVSWLTEVIQYNLLCNVNSFDSSLYPFIQYFKRFNYLFSCGTCLKFSFVSFNSPWIVSFVVRLVYSEAAFWPLSYILYSPFCNANFFITIPHINRISLLLHRHRVTWTDMNDLHFAFPYHPNARVAVIISPLQAWIRLSPNIYQNYILWRSNYYVA